MMNYKWDIVYCLFEIMQAGSINITGNWYWFMIKWAIVLLNVKFKICSLYDVLIYQTLIETNIKATNIS